MINDILITGNFQHTRQFTCITLLVVHVSLCNAVTGMQFTLVNKFGEISPTRAGSYCQRTSCRKWAVLCKMQKFHFFTTSPLNMRACGTGRKFAEYDQREFRQFLPERRAFTGCIKK
jgi:hypothetical protein